MLSITSPEIFCRVVEEAKHRTGGDERWIHAITRAAEEIHSNPMMTWMDGYMLIQSPDSAEVYEANGACQCKAFEFRKACWHRAAARLWKRYLEAVATSSLPRVATEAAAPLVARTPRKVERVGGIQI
jgi:hypothetical protein